MINWTGKEKKTWPFLDLIIDRAPLVSKKNSQIKQSEKLKSVFGWIALSSICYVGSQVDVGSF